MATAALIALVAVIVGFFIGAVGVGGVLLIPALVLLGGLDIHQASATALFTFLFTGFLGTWLFARRGSLDWRLAVSVCAGSAIFSYLGAMANSRIDARPLTLVIAAIIVFSGVYVLLPSRHGEDRYRDGRSAAQQVLLACIGAGAGFGSGLSGAGGPLFSVPLMLAFGFAPLASVGTGQVLQIVVAALGTVGNLQFGSIDYTVAGWIVGFLLLGVVAGTRAAHALGVKALRRTAAGLCIAVGVFMLARAL